MAALRGIKNAVGNYSIGELKVREATTNETWGPTTSQLAEISDITHQLLHFHEVMSMIEKRLNDKGKNFRHVAKALLVLDYVIKTGSERVIQYWKDKLYIINTLKDFQFTDKEAKDQGRTIRDRAKQITVLLNDNELLLAERTKALETKKKFHSGELVPASSSDLTTRSWEPERKGLQGKSTNVGSQPGSTPNLSADIKAALPINRGEEDLQLQLALALSKEDSETKDQRTEQEAHQLKSALQISKANTNQKLTPGMIAPPPGSRAVEPWQSLPEPSQTAPGSGLGDPWTGGSGEAANLQPVPEQELLQGDQPDLSDPWGGELRGRLDSPVQAQETDPWGDLTSAPADSPALKPTNLTNEIVMGPDPWGGSVKPTEPSEVALLDRPLSPPKDPLLALTADAQGGANTVESEFLGQNAKLVNLDALVDLGRAPAAGSGQEGNPFAMLPPDTTSKTASNPFLANVSPRPTLNQMRDTSKPDPLQAPLISSAPAGPGQPPPDQLSQASELASIFQNPLPSGPQPSYPPSMFPSSAPAPQLGQRPAPDYSGLSGLSTGTSSPYAGYSAPTQPGTGFSVPTQLGTGFSVPTQPGTGFSVPTQPGTGFSVPTQLGTGFSAPTQPGTGFSAPSQPATGYSALSQIGTGFSVPSQTGTGFSAGSQTSAGFPNFSTGQSESQGLAGFGTVQGAPGVSTGTTAPHGYNGTPSFPQSSNPFF